MTPAPKPPRCDTCARPVRPWQPYDGWGPAGFNRKTAHRIWHTKCGQTRRPIYRPIPPREDQ